MLDALSLQIELTQTSIAQSLDLPPMSGHPKVSRVRIEDQGTIKIDGRRGMHLQGQFDWQLPGDRFQVDSPFDLYLEQGEKQQSWRLAQPASAQTGPRGGSTLADLSTSPELNHFKLCQEAFDHLTVCVILPKFLVNRTRT